VGDLVPYNDQSGRTRREVRKAEAAGSVARARIDARENAAAYEASTIIANTAVLTVQAGQGLARIHSTFAELAGDDQGLGMGLGLLEANYTRQAGRAINDYGDRPRR
jgi:hypothetical protein